jgi:hypothetical protein
MSSDMNELEPAFQPERKAESLRESDHSMTDLPIDEHGLEAPRQNQSSTLAVLGGWWREGARTAFLRKPRWSGLQLTPVVVAWLIAVPYLLVILIERLYIPGDANFYWPALEAGWLFTFLTLGICWAMASQKPDSSIAVDKPGAAALFSMMAAQGLTIILILGCLLVPMERAGLFSSGKGAVIVSWTVWILPIAWTAAARGELLWRSSAKRPLTKVVAVIALASLLFVELWVRSFGFWYPDSSADTTARHPFELTQDLWEKQTAILPEQLGALKAERPGVVDLYAITYSPYADEDVFRRESSMVAGVMETRFGTQKRTIQLVNHRDTALELPWATPLNLRRTIQKMATLMNRDEDILFIHLTSHGAHDGELSTRFRPLKIDALTPVMLKTWLDEAGIRYSVISVSACYSGSWIAPLKGDDTLVMTAADADHTSYGCGHGSELTYFGRAMFDEQLRHTRSFEEAHAAARKVIDERERAAGKPDGYSNPQIAMGAGIRTQLARMNGELEAGDSRADRATP